MITLNKEQISLVCNHPFVDGNKRTGTYVIDLRALDIACIRLTSYRSISLILSLMVSRLIILKWMRTL